jgi:arsenite methyltransferase
MDDKRDIVSESDALTIKSCCADAYQSDWAKLILGDSFHPGGTALTDYLGNTLHLGPGQRVLDVAAGQGTSAIYLAQRFGCTVSGIEYSRAAVESATRAAQSAGVAHLVTFEQGDAECLPVPATSFDAVICECAFCTFPNKSTAAAEFMRVLKPGGHVGLSDLTRQGEIPAGLQTLLAWIACIADAQPLESYVRYLTEAGLAVQLVEQHDEALSNMIRDIQAKLLGTELLVKLKKINLPNEIDFEQAKLMAKTAATAIKARQFGYAVITAVKL